MPGSVVETAWVAAEPLPAPTPINALDQSDLLTSSRPLTPSVPPAPIADSRRITREEAVQAYVSGRIPVSEFLRIARGVGA